jgi:hypothetical protein
MDDEYGAYWADTGVTANSPQEAAQKLIEQLTEYLRTGDGMDWQFESWEQESES